MSARFCHNCGNLLNEGARFCHVCGTVIAAAPAPTPAPVQAPVQSDDAIIAAICAAIEAYRAEEGLSGLPYRVVSFKRKSGKRSWTGTNED